MQNCGAVINKCYNYNANVVGSASATGGVVGRSDGITISNSYNYLTSTSKFINCGSNVGGIVGIIHSDSDRITQIYNCYNIGESIYANDSHVGAILGANGKSGTIISNCYFLSTSSLSGIGYSAASMGTNNITQKANTYFQGASTTSTSVAYLLGNSVWGRSSSINGGYPYILTNQP